MRHGVVENAKGKIIYDIAENAKKKFFFWSSKLSQQHKQ